MKHFFLSSITIFLCAHLFYSPTPLFAAREDIPLRKISHSLDAEHPCPQIPLVRYSNPTEIKSLPTQQLRQKYLYLPGSIGELGRPSCHSLRESHVGSTHDDGNDAIIDALQHPETPEKSADIIQNLLQTGTQCSYSISPGNHGNAFHLAMQLALDDPSYFDTLKILLNFEQQKFKELQSPSTPKSLCKQLSIHIKDSRGKTMQDYLASKKEVIHAKAEEFAIGELCHSDIFEPDFDNKYDSEKLEQLKALLEEHERVCTEIIHAGHHEAQHMHQIKALLQEINVLRQAYK